MSGLENSFKSQKSHKQILRGNNTGLSGVRAASARRGYDELNLIRVYDRWRTPRVPTRAVDRQTRQDASSLSGRRVINSRSGHS